MYTSDIDTNAEKAAKTAFVYLLVSLFCVCFGAVYEAFSHGVYSFYMIYAFLFPLTGGTLPFFILHFAHVKAFPGTLSRHLYHWGISTLTVGSIVKGILEIYGTTNTLTGLYRIVGSLLLAAGIGAYCMELSRDPE